MKSNSLIFDAGYNTNGGLNQLFNSENFKLFNITNGVYDQLNAIVESFKTADISGSIADWFKLDEQVDLFDKLNPKLAQYTKEALAAVDVNNRESVSVQSVITHLQTKGAVLDWVRLKQTALNMVVNGFIGLAASLGVQLALWGATKIIQGIDDYIHRTERMVELTQDLKQQFEEMDNTLADHAKTVSEIADRYEELLTGVNPDNNQNMSLSTEDYEEFLEINEQLAEIFPNLRTRIDENGNAILDLGRNGGIVADQLQEMLDAEEASNNLEISQNIGDYFAGVAVQIDQAREAMEGFQQTESDVANQTQNMKSVLEQGVDLENNPILSGNLTEEAGMEYYNAISRGVENFRQSLDGIRRAELADIFDIDQMVNTDDQTGIFEFLINTATLTPDEISALEASINDQVAQVEPILTDAVNEMSAEALDAQSTIEQTWTDFLPRLLSATEAKGSFQMLENQSYGEDLQQFVSDFILNMDSSMYTALEDYNANDPYAYIRDTIVTQLLNFSDADAKKFSEAYQKLLELNPQDLAQQNQQAIDELIRQLASMLGMTDEDIPTLKINLGFEVEDTYRSAYDSVIQELQDRYGTSQTESENFLTGLEIDTEDEIVALRSLIDTYEDLIDLQKGYYELSHPYEVFSNFEGSSIGGRLDFATDEWENGVKSTVEYFTTLQNEINNFDASQLTDEFDDVDAAMQQLSMDMIQQVGIGFQEAIKSFDEGLISVSEHLENLVTLSDTLNTLTDFTQNLVLDSMGSAATNAVDGVQTQLNTAVSAVEALLPTSQALEAILHNTVQQGTEDWQAYSNVVVQGIMNIQAAGGIMAEQSAARLGTTYDEISANLVTNMDFARQVIQANLNTSINDMGSAIEQIFSWLAEAVSNFRVDFTFERAEKGVGAFINGLVSGEKLTYTLAAGENTIAGVRSFAQQASDQISSYLQNQALIELPDWSNTEVDFDSYTPSSYVTAPYENELAKIQEANKEAASETKDTFEETFDFFERRVTVLEDAFANLEAAIENVIGADAKNTLLSAQLGILDEEVNNYTDALAMYQQKANESLAGLDSELQDRIINGAVAITDFVGEGNEEVVQAMEDYQGWADKVAECTQKLEELKTQIRQLELEKFNNIVEDFTNQFDLFGDSIDLIDQQIGLFEEAGQLIGESFYQSQIDQTQKQLATLEAERDALVSQMSESLSSGRIPVGSDEWLEMQDALTDVESSILDCKTAVEEFDNAILQIHWDMFDRVQTEFGNLNDELDNLAGLFDDFNDINVSDGYGNWTDQAIATLGLYAQQYELAKYQVEQYNDAIDRLNYQYQNGDYSATEYMDKLAELTQGQWDAVNSMEAMEDAIMDLNEARINEGIETLEEEIDAYKELTDAQIEAIEATEDLREKKETLAEKSKAVADIERQLAAMQNDDTAATVAQRKLLEEQLAEAKKDLADTEHDYSIEAQKDALNQNYEDFEEARNAEIERLQELLKNRELLISQSMETVKANAALVGEQIALIAQEHGVVVSNAVITPWQNGANAIAGYGSVLTAQTSAFMGNIMNVEYSIYDLQNQANATASTLAYMFSTRADNLVGQLVASYNSEANLANMTNALQNSLINTLERGYDISSITSALSSIASGANSVASAANNAASALSRMGAVQSTVSTSDLSGDNKTKYRIVDTKYGRTIESDLTYQEAKQNLYTKYRDTSKYLTIMRMAKGGIISKSKDRDNPMDLIARSLGEDVMIAAKDQESVLTPIQTQGLLDLAPMLENIKQTFNPIANQSIQTNSLYDRISGGVELNCQSLFEFNGDFNNTEQLLTAMKAAGVQGAKELLNQINRNFRYK